MERQRVVVVVEEAEASRAALQWAMSNYIRCEDSITLLHVCPLVRSRQRRRNLRLKGFQLALSFKDHCNGIAEAKVEIVVAEGEQADTVVSTVNKLGATTLILGLHHGSFLYRAANPYVNRRNLRCRIIGVKQHPAVEGVPLPLFNLELELEVSQVETLQLRAAEAKIPFPICAIPLGSICGNRKKQNQEDHKRRRRRYILL